MSCLGQPTNPFSSAAVRGLKLTKLRHRQQQHQCGAAEGVGTRHSGLGGGSHRAAWFATLAGNSSTGGEFTLAKEEEWGQRRGGSGEPGFAHYSRSRSKEFEEARGKRV